MQDHSAENLSSIFCPTFSRGKSSKNAAFLKGGASFCGFCLSNPFLKETAVGQILDRRILSLRYSGFPINHS
ncbi:MAG: hypothetical protein IPO62_01305 [Saprospiraceae bacterium]|nr:hypothetical protein [Saprospiraceae bacterium]